MVDFYEAAFAVLKSDVDSGLLYEEDASIVNDILYTKYAAFSENGPVMVESVDVVQPIVDTVVYEAVTKSGKLRERLEKIKKAKPDEFSGDPEVKGYVDENYDKLMSAARILEKEPQKITVSQYKELVGIVLSVISFYGGLAFGATTGSGVLVVAGLAGYVIGLIAVIVHAIITIVRANNDVRSFKELSKISSALKKAKNRKGMPEKYQRKIQELINAIDDAETEISGKFKVTNESSEITEEDVNSMRLRVYEAFEEGAITDDDKHMMLEMLNLENYE